MLHYFSQKNHEASHGSIKYEQFYYMCNGRNKCTSHNTDAFFKIVFSILFIIDSICFQLITIKEKDLLLSEISNSKIENRNLYRRII